MSASGAAVAVGDRDVNVLSGPIHCPDERRDLEMAFVERALRTVGMPDPNPRQASGTGREGHCTSARLPEQGPEPVQQILPGPQPLRNVQAGQGMEWLVMLYSYRTCPSGFD